MKYIDTGSRKADHSLGAWLSRELNDCVTELRFQTGFFGAEVLGLFAPILKNLAETQGKARFLIGSNDGATRTADIEQLLELIKPTWKRCKVGIVSFDNAYFHPKCVHLKRRDGSSAAYVGSANLTGKGVASIHVESGILLDTAEDDDPSVLESIAAAIDWWFTNNRAGMYLVRDKSDLESLARDGILDVPTPTSPSKFGYDKQHRNRPRNYLTGLFSLPPPPTKLLPSASRSRPESIWWKKLTRSDAQRKPSGNQRGSITLVKAGHSIDPQTFFRHTFFSDANWRRETTRTNEIRETAVIVFDVTILDEHIGRREIQVTHAPNRESGQHNYTSLLHLHPELTPYFSRTDMTGKWLILTKTDQTYSLTIQNGSP